MGAEVISPNAERAIQSALNAGRAILKYISPNDVGLTGGHQCGYYLPKQHWSLFSSEPPTKGINSESTVRVEWQDGRETDSRIKWYGKSTRSEYRLTKFGKDFPFLATDCVGDLLVLVPTSRSNFQGFVLDLEEDIEELQAALGIELIGTITVYGGEENQWESKDKCVERFFRAFVKELRSFPSGITFSNEARSTLQKCSKSFNSLLPDDALVECMDAEYKLFRLAERQICQTDIIRPFKDVDDFLKTASSIMNRRKSRAGRSLAAC